MDGSRSPQRHVRSPRRSHPAGDPGSSVSWGGVGYGTGQAVRPEPSRHLETLKSAAAGGACQPEPKAQWRPCRLDGARLKEAADWVGEYRQFWDESFERLDEYLATVQKEETHDSESRDHDGKN